MSELKTVVKALEKLFPPRLAARSWDNVGLLVDSLASKPKPTKILLTIDLTNAVAEEAVAMGASLVVAYHPFIFRGLKKIVQSNTQQKSLLKLVQAGVAVYSPHTSVDAAIGGVNDWLADGVSGGRCNETSRSILEACEDSEAAKLATITKKDDPANEIEPGMGRLVTLSTAITLDELISRVKKLLGLPYVQLALSPYTDKTSIMTIAICAGSGSSVFSGVSADVCFTGELSHHELLAMTENGISAIVCGHSNTERGYLVQLKKLLFAELGADESAYSISISSKDKDPLEVV